MEIPLPKSMQNEDNIFNYGFDGSLNRSSVPPVIESNIEKTVQDVLANSGIDINTINKSTTGNSFERKDYNWLTLFDGIDGYVNSGCSYVNANVKVLTGALSGNQAYIMKQIVSAPSYIGFDKDLSFRSDLYVAQDSAQTIYLVFGNTVFGSDSGTYIGFKIINNGIYGVVNDGVSETATLLKTFSGLNTSKIYVKYIKGTGAFFYIDDVLIKTITTGFPTGSNKYLMNIWVTTNENVAKYMLLTYWDFWQAN